MAILKSCSSKEREIFDMVIRCVHAILFTQILNDHCSVTVKLLSSLQTSFTIAWSDFDF